MGPVLINGLKSCEVLQKYGFRTPDLDLGFFTTVVPRNFEIFDTLFVASKTLNPFKGRDVIYGRFLDNDFRFSVKKSSFFALLLLRG